MSLYSVVNRWLYTGSYDDVCVCVHAKQRRFSYLVGFILNTLCYNQWEDNIKQNICQMKVKNWIICIQDQGRWKEVFEKAKTFCD
jgi:hypothetical protein